MADIVITTVAKVSEYIIGPVIREGKYFLCVGKIIKDIENERNELIFERDNLLDRVEQAKQRTEIIEKPVEKWLHDVQSLLARRGGRIRTKDGSKHQLLSRRISSMEKISYQTENGKEGRGIGKIKMQK